MKRPDHISESLKTIFGLKYLNSLMRLRDPGWKKFGSGIQDQHPGSATLGAGTICNTLLAATETTTNVLSRKTREKNLASFPWI